MRAIIMPDEIQNSIPVIYAGFWCRVGAALLDKIFSILITFVIGFAFGLTYGVTAGLYHAHVDKDVLRPIGALIGFAEAWLYYTLFESSGWQATPGKRILKIIVTDGQGRRISFGRANARYWSKILSALILCIGYIMIGFTKRKQGLHDMIADTLVIRE